jgi:predicted ATP-dependent endonuclease of OLD family
MEDGLVLIDEPELHLHPQLQESCIKLIADLSQQLHIQWIMTTHSPAMINQETIHDVVRCFWNEGYTNIIQPQTRLMQDDGMLFQMLRF